MGGVLIVAFPQFNLDGLEKRNKRTAIKNTAIRASNQIVRLCIHQSNNQLVTIETAAMIFACIGMTLSRCQLRIKGANHRWRKSQMRNCRELDEKAHSASSKKGVVGIPGRTIPIAPRPTAMLPTPIKNALFRGDWTIFFFGVMMRVFVIVAME